MSDPLLLQVDWFVDYEPPWLGTAIMLVGIACVAVSYTRTVSVQKSTFYYVYGLSALSVAVAPWFLVYPEPFVVVLSFTGNWFQGVGLVRGFLKLRSYIRRGVTAAKRWIASLLGRTDGYQRDTGGGLTGVFETIGWLLLFQLAGLLALTMSVWVGFGLTVYGELTFATLTTDIVITWTLVTLFGGILGLVWRFWSVRDTLPSLLLFGVVLLSVGAELHNFRSLDTDVALFLLNKGVFALGFVGAVAVFVIKWKEAHTDSTHEVFA
jgi:hypothetical protein